MGSCFVDVSVDRATGTRLADGRHVVDSIDCVPRRPWLWSCRRGISSCPDDDGHHRCALERIASPSRCSRGRMRCVQAGDSAFAAMFRSRGVLRRELQSSSRRGDQRAERRRWLLHSKPRSRARCGAPSEVRSRHDGRDGWPGLAARCRRPLRAQRQSGARGRHLAREVGVGGRAFCKWQRRARTAEPRESRVGAARADRLFPEQ